MSGCFGGSTIDRYMERSLHEYLDSQVDHALEAAERRFGCILGEHPEHGYVFKNGFGHPSFEQDEDGWSLCGIKDADTWATKTGKVLVREWPRKEYDPAIGRSVRVRGLFFTIEEP